MRRTRVDLDGALALVTGAGRGIGRATALGLSRRGARVVCADVDGDAAEKAAVACAEVGPDGAPATVDVADRNAVFALADAVRTEYGPVDILVNNAGVGMTGRFLDTTLDDWDWILGVNLGSVINFCSAFGPHMVDRGRGHVVNVSSGLAYTPRSSQPAYATSKAAVLTLSRCLRADWGPQGVGVSAICPGIIDTGIVGRTRYRGDQDDPKVRANVARVFRKGHPPARVADAIVHSVERNRAVVPVGWESHLGWWFSRFGPLRAHDLLARTELF